MEITKNKTAEIIDHHLSAFMNADVDEILKDYTEESEILTPQGALKGLSQIRYFFEETFKVVPKGSTLNMMQQLIRDDIAYLAYSGDSTFVSLPIGTDTFFIKDDKIICQTLAAHMIPKQ